MSEIDVIYVLEEWRIYPDKSQIERENETVHLEPKIMEVLVYLIKHANRVISREELTEQVWQSKYASDEVITRAISVLRKKLDDTGKVHRFIKTIPKHGYVLEYDFNISKPKTTPVSSQKVKPVNIKGGIDPIINKIISPKLALMIAAISLVTVFIVIALPSTPAQVIKKNDISINIKQIEAIDNLPSSQMVARVLSEQLITTLSNSDVVKINLNSTSNISQTQSYLISGGVKEVDSEYLVNIHFSNAKSGLVLWSQSFAGEKGRWHELVNNISTTIDHFITVAKTEHLDLSNLSLRELQASTLIYQVKELRLNNLEESLKLSIDILNNALITYENNTEIVYQLALSMLIKQYYYPNKTLNDEQGNAYQNLDSTVLEQLMVTLKESINLQQKLKHKWRAKFLFIRGLHRFILQSSMINKSIDELEEAKNVLTENSELLALLGDLYRLNAEPEKAEKVLNLALNYNNSLVMAIFNKAKLLSQQSKNSRAITLIKSYLNNNNNNLPLNQLLINLYLADGDFDKAINYINGREMNTDALSMLGSLSQGYFYLNYTLESQKSLQQLASNLGQTDQFIQECNLLNLRGLYIKAEEFCKLADENAMDITHRFNYAKNLLLQGNYQKSLELYKKYFAFIDDDLNNLPVNYLITQKIDYIWLLYKNDQKELARHFAKPLLAYFSNTNRLGYKGYGICDVILLLASNKLDQGFERFKQAIDQGWIHWFDINYNGPHPALREIQQLQNFAPIKRYLEQTLNSKRQGLHVKFPDIVPVYISQVHQR